MLLWRSTPVSTGPSIAPWRATLSGSSPASLPSPLDTRCGFSSARTPTSCQLPSDQHLHHSCGLSRTSSTQQTYIQLTVDIPPVSAQTNLRYGSHLRQVRYQHHHLHLESALLTSLAMLTISHLPLMLQSCSTRRPLHHHLLLHQASRTPTLRCRHRRG